MTPNARGERRATRHRQPRLGKEPLVWPVRSSAWFGWGRPVALRTGSSSGPLPSPGVRLLEHLLRPDEERRRQRDPERLGGLEVKDQLELRGLLHR